ncbi:MAG TPA: efflux RND transporter periplasmic adaptor subunit [Blastocatellia bacterium]|jgi:RND family efflux transporter MFP subunit|nr:efflux RND transporter periplasmic adaptor subunit [Blastocatellia bacterium]
MRNQTSIQEKGKLRTSKTLVLTMAVVAVSLAAACANSQAKDEAKVASNSQPAASPTPVDVATAPAITRNLQRDVEVVGSFAADEEVVISAQVAGELSQINVDFGSYVSQGQVIATIDQRDAKLKVEQAEATLKQTLARLGMKEGEKFDSDQNADVRVAKSQLDWAKLELDRSVRLIEKGDIPRSSYDEKVTNHNLAQARYQAALDSVSQQLAAVEQQKAALALAKKALTDTVVRSPISGAVKEKHASRGSYLTVNGRIVTLVKINPLRLRADIPESSAAAVRTGQTINVTVDAFPNRAFTGRVVRIGPSLDEKTRALTVEAEVANPGNLLRPGMFAKSRLITSANAPAVMVPQRAVVTVAGLSKVFVIENGKAVERIVKTGAIDGDLIEIAEGVKDGAIVATSNLDKLLTGAAVNAGK